MSTPESGGCGARGVVLREIRVYPLKSARGLSVDRWEVDDFGQTLDRRWMVVDEDGRYLTQRSHPRLALVRPTLEADALVLSAPGAGSLSLSLEPAGGPELQVTVWGGSCRARDLGAGPARWMSGFLGERVRVVHMPRDTFRPVKESPSNRVSFTDGYPFLLLSAEALAELNERLAEPVSVDRFRPNLVVEGAGAHAEDRWRRIRIGDLTFRVVKPCPRCVVTTVNQESGEKGSEPLRTLARYRRNDGKVYFGQNLVHDGRGVLEKGEAVRVLEAGEPRPNLARAASWASLAETKIPGDK